MIGFQSFGKGRVPLFEAYHEGGLAGYLWAPSWLIGVLPGNVSFDVGVKVHSLDHSPGRSREHMETVRNLTLVDCDVVDTGSLGDDWPTTNALATRLSQAVPQNGVGGQADRLVFKGLTWKVKAAILKATAAPALDALGLMLSQNVHVYLSFIPDGSTKATLTLV